MKVAFYSYPSAFQNPGGGEIQLLKTKEYLERLDVGVKLFDQWHDRLDDYDILHVFGSVKDCVGLMQTARNKKIKIALSPIFWSSFKRALHEGGSIFKRVEFSARHLTKLLFPLLPTGRRKTMVLSDIIFPNSEMEKEQLIRLFAIPPDRIKIVPNGIDEKFLKSTPGLFVEKFGIKNFVLAVGRVEPRKNQLNLIKALKGCSLKLVMIGSPVSDFIWYYKKCRREAGQNVIFLERIEHGDELLASAYAACKVFIAPGWFETPGLAALEAAASGAGVAITRYGSTKEYFADGAAYFDPSNIAQIRGAVFEAFEIDSERKMRLKRRIRDRYLWENVARETLRGYKSVCEWKNEKEDPFCDGDEAGDNQDGFRYTGA